MKHCGFFIRVCDFGVLGEVMLAYLKNLVGEYAPAQQIVHVRLAVEDVHETTQ